MFIGLFVLLGDMPVLGQSLFFRLDCPPSPLWGGVEAVVSLRSYSLGQPYTLFFQVNGFQWPGARLVLAWSS